MSDSVPWMRYAPTSEQEVVVLFALLLPHLPIRFELDEVHKDFPDCLAWRLNPDGTRSKVRIEFELFASNFIEHRHDPKGCDCIVCWEDNLQGDGELPQRLTLKDFVENASPPVMALPPHPKREVKVWNAKTFLAKCPRKLQPLQGRLLQWAKRHGEVIWAKGAKIPCWRFAVSLDKGQRHTLFGVYGNGKVWVYRSPELPIDRMTRYQNYLALASKFRAALASGKAWFEASIQEEGVVEALQAAARVASGHKSSKSVVK